MKIGPLELFKKTVIGAEAPIPLLIRYTIFRLPAFGIYVHHLLRSDYDRSLHDHPWSFVSILLTGDYYEVHDQTRDRSQVTEWRPRGSVLIRPAQWRHRIIVEKPLWTMILVGRREQRWGFHLDTGWCWWRKHNPFSNICEEKIVHYGGKD